MDLYYVYLSGLRIEDARNASFRYKDPPTKVNQSKRSGPKWVFIPD